MRKILVIADKKFILTVPDEATLSFAPWSPPNRNGDKNLYSPVAEKNRGTLRIYSSGLKSPILACFSDVVSFRDMSIGYAEEIVKEEGATIWRDDEKGYYRDAKVSRTKEWASPALGEATQEGEPNDLSF
ncbi:MAG: hypothetical protein ACHQX3_06570 [Nitrospirales bacterium]